MPKTVHVGVPVNLRPTLRNIEDIQMNNNIVSVPTELSVCGEIDTAFAKSKKVIEELKKSVPVFYALYYICVMITIMPFNINKWFLNFASDGLSLVFSTPLLSPNSWILNGNKCKGLFYFVP